MSLERTQLTQADIYIMHRDNPDIPVGEFIDVLNELVDQKLLKVFGGSNWSIDRFEQANVYAKKAGKQPMSILNNNLSLALQIKPLWGGCVHVSDAQSLARLKAMNVTQFSWSSQARGYFLPDDQWQKLGPGNFECWDCEENRKRRQRAFELAEQKGVSAINIAAAYVLNQPFESFALVGPRNIEELTTTLPGLDIPLTPAELAYLSLQADAITA
jgi:aryl-alcohol dehydrogenase-like predicted oxidoreductase